jgi:hypothetical protein
MKFTEQQLRRLIASDNGRTVGLVMLETIREGREIEILMKTGSPLTLADPTNAELALSRVFGWPPGIKT